MVWQRGKHEGKKERRCRKTTCTHTHTAYTIERKNTSGGNSSSDTGMNIENQNTIPPWTILSQAIYVSLIVDVVCTTSTTNEDDYHFNTCTEIHICYIRVCAFSWQLIHIWPNKFYEILWVVNCVYAIRIIYLHANWVYERSHLDERRKSEGPFLFVCCRIYDLDVYTYILPYMCVVYTNTMSAHIRDIE